ncbi:taste receptor type 2 member 140-like [Anomaloglossus baeobatrachus]|uniref:taste receptor type 2 member 140-like n=1 Tax=Anomaloglossus baeobatrachus TaxID=238106 RepID=UPI003F5051DF
MPSVFWTLVLIVLFLDTGLSLSLNVCIVISASRSIKNGVKVSPPDVIHLVMGLVGLVLQCCLTVQSYLFVLYTSILFMKKIYVPMTLLNLALIYFMSWLHAWLSAYYCTSIANFTHQLFLWSKRTIPSSLWLLLLLSAVESLVIGVSSIWSLIVETEDSSSDNCTDEVFFVKGTFYFSLLHVQIATVLGSFLPFVLTLLSILLTFSSLIRHMRRMKKSYCGITQQAHIKAIRSISLLLSLSAVFCIAQLMLFSGKASSSPDVLVTISWFLITVFPTANAIITIQVSSNIQKTFVKTFWARKRRN